MNLKALQIVTDSAGTILWNIAEGMERYDNFQAAQRKLKADAAKAEEERVQADHDAFQQLLRDRAAAPTVASVQSTLEDLASSVQQQLRGVAQAADEARASAENAVALASAAHAASLPQPPRHPYENVERDDDAGDYS